MSSAESRDHRGDFGTTKGTSLSIQHPTLVYARYFCHIYGRIAYPMLLRLVSCLDMFVSLPYLSIRSSTLYAEHGIYSSLSYVENKDIPSDLAYPTVS